MKKRYEIFTTAYDKRGRVIARAVNSYDKTNTWQKQLSELVGASDKREYLHSEVACLIKVRNLRKQAHSLLIERYDAEGKPKNAFPCISCRAAIKLSGVKVVLFTTEEGIKEYYP